MGMLNFVLDSFRGEIFEFKVKRRVLVASTVMHDKKFYPHTLYSNVHAKHDISRLH